MLDDNKPSVVIYDESSRMYYKKPTWTYSKYSATRMTDMEADYEIRVINAMYEEFMKNSVIFEVSGN